MGREVPKKFDVKTKIQISSIY